MTLRHPAPRRHARRRAGQHGVGAAGGRGRSARRRRPPTEELRLIREELDPGRGVHQVAMDAIGRTSRTRPSRSSMTSRLVRTAAGHRHGLLARGRQRCPRRGTGAEPWAGGTGVGPGRARSAAGAAVVPRRRRSATARTLRAIALTGRRSSPAPACSTPHVDRAHGRRARIGDGSVRVRITDPSRIDRSEIVREAHDEPTLGGRARLPSHPSDGRRIAVHRRPVVWNSLYSPPPRRGADAPTCAGTGRAAGVADPASLPAGSDRSRSGRRAREADCVDPKAPRPTLATSTSEPFPAVLFFATLVAATRAGVRRWSNDFRLQANARCMEATDPRRPRFRLSVLA